MDVYLPPRASLEAEAWVERPSDDFTGQVMAHADGLKRGTFLVRACFGPAVALTAVSLQDAVLALTPVLVQSLIEIDGHLPSQLLTLPNTVQTGCCARR
jgi:hypothetical protein